jgi:hypothetical protein
MTRRTNKRNRHQSKHKTTRRNKIRKIRRQTSKSHRKKHTRTRKGGAKYSFGGTLTQKQFLDSFFPNETDVAKMSSSIKYPYNVSFDDRGAFLGADFRYYLPKGAYLSSNYKNLTIDDYGVIAKKPAGELLLHRENLITYFTAITRLIDAQNNNHGLLGCNRDIYDSHERYEYYPAPPSSNGAKREAELNSIYSPLIKMLNSNLWDFDREIRGRCITYTRLNGKTVVINCGEDGFFVACFSLNVNDKQIGFVNMSQEACQYVKIRFIILMICIMFDMNRVSPGIQEEWFAKIKEAEDLFISNITYLISDRKGLEMGENEMIQKHREFYNNYLEFMIGCIDDLFLNNAELQSYNIREIDLYYLLITIEPRSFFQEYALIYLQNNFQDIIVGAGINDDTIISFNQIQDMSQYTFNEAETVVINRLFDLKGRDTIVNYIENGVTTNIQVENGELVIRQYILFGMFIKLPGDEDERIYLGFILEEKTVNITRNTYVSLCKFRWVLTSENRRRMMEIFGEDGLLALFPYFNSIIPIDELSRQRNDILLNPGYNRTVLLYPSGIHATLSSGLVPIRNMTDFGRRMYTASPAK